MRHQQGLTMIELLVTVSILAILMAVALPSFQTFFASNRLATANSDLQSTLNLARSEAIRRGMTVTLVRGGGTDKHWENGWTMVVDANNDGDTSDAGETLRDVGPASDNITIVSDEAFKANIAFQPSGRVTGGVFGSFYICHDGDVATARRIVINAIGRIRSETTNQCS